MNFNIEPPYEVMDPDQPWYGKGRPGGVPNTSTTWKELWWKLTGQTKPGGGSYVSTVKLSGPDADLLISNMQKDDRGYPQFNESGVGFVDFYDALSKFQNWLVEQYLTPEKEINDTTQAVVEEEAQAEEDEIVEEIEDNLEEASEVAEEKIKEIGQETEDLTDIVNLLPPTLLAAVNQKLGTDYEKEKKEPKKSTSVTNNRILKSLTENLTKIQGQLDLTNKLLTDQNDLLRSNLAVSVQYLDQIQVNDGLLESKFDAILDALRAQAAVAEQQADDLETANAEADLEQIRDAAGTEGFDDLSQGGRRGGRQNRIARFYRNRLLRKLYRRLPRRLRRLRTRARRLQKAPGRLTSRASNRIVNRFAPRLGSATTRITSAGRGLNRLPKAGPLKYALAGVEYADRKASGQNDFQALSGVGAGLAGAAAGGTAGAKSGAVVGGTIGAFFGGVGAAPGAAIGGVIGGILGSIAGGMAGGGIADKVTGANNYETGTPLLGAVDPVASMVSPVAGMLLGVTQSFMRYSGGSMPEIQKEISTLSSTFGMAPTLVRPDLGGTYAGVGRAVKSAEKKGDPDVESVRMSAEDEKVLKELENQAGTNNFFQKLMTFFGVKGHTETNVSDPDASPDDSGNGGEIGGDGKFIQGNSGASYGIHYHIAPGSYKDGNITDPSGNADARKVAEKVVKFFQGKKTIYIGRSKEWVREGDSGEDIKKKIKRGQEVHTASGSQGGIDLQIGGAYYPGAAVEFPLKTEDMKYRTGGFGVTAKVSGANASVAHGRYDENGRQAPQTGEAMYYKGGDTPSTATSIVVGDRGKEKVMKNLVASFQPVSDMLDAYNAASSTTELIAATKQYSPDILMYDEEMEQEATSIIIMNVGNQQPQMTPQAPEPSSVEAIPHTRITAARTMVLNSLY